MQGQVKVPLGWEPRPVIALSASKKSPHISPATLQTGACRAPFQYRGRLEHSFTCMQAWQLLCSSILFVRPADMHTCAGLGLGSTQGV